MSPRAQAISWRKDVAVLPFLVPFYAVFVLFIAWPVFYSLWISLHRVTIYSDFYDLFGSMQFVGLGNYTRVVTDPVFWWSVVLTFVYAGFTIAGTLVLSLTLALALRGRRRGLGFLRTGFFLPHVFDLFVVGVIWLLLYNPNGGPIAWLIAKAGAEQLAAEGVLGNPWTVLPAISLAVILKNAGFGMILFLVSLYNIDESLYEAASIDGAGKARQLMHISLPLLKPTILFLVITGMVASLNAFSEIFSMTDATGGPSLRLFGETLQGARISAFHLFMRFNESSYGEAAAISFILLVITILISLVNFRLLRSDH